MESRGKQWFSWDPTSATEFTASNPAGNVKAHARFYRIDSYFSIFAKSDDFLVFFMKISDFRVFRDYKSNTSVFDPRSPGWHIIYAHPFCQNWQFPDIFTQKSVFSTEFH